MDSILNYNQAQQGQNQSAQQQQQQGGLGGGLMDLASQLMGQSGGGFDLKALLAGANMQHGNPHDLEKPMTNVLSSIQTVQRPDAAVDESALAQAHQQAYNNGHANPTQAHQLSTEGMGAAAAIQAFKDFAGAGTRQAQEGPGHQSLISKLLGMAMSEAVKLFQKSGGAADGGSEASRLPRSSHENNNYGPSSVLLVSRASHCTGLALIAHLTSRACPRLHLHFPRISRPLTPGRDECCWAGSHEAAHPEPGAGRARRRHRLGRERPKHWPAYEHCVQVHGQVISLT